ncbi:hypothetical protein ACJJTC_017385 [Scirpophaga incertulas]
MMVQTHALGVVERTTYHPSRLSGLWDMMNTDSVVDLVIGLGLPPSKVVISLPATARKFTLSNATLSTPGSPTMEDQPKEIDQAELCRLLQKGRWTLERDQDLSGPYAFKNTTWISFEDSSSVDVKGKYARVRGLAGLALHDADRDVETPCGPTLKTALVKVLNQQSRAPRAAVLRSLEHEILSAPGQVRTLDALQVSPYRITQVVDSDGVIHSIREDTRTEFKCSRQGYFVHPRSCARFYRCVKFDQLSPEFTVFEFDCPAGLAFDSRYEVCVWPGSLPHSQACPGSSEIAPVPDSRFVCQLEGYYADPENCRWFFACVDHGGARPAAYEFRCPFGLGFDAARRLCDWPWRVPGCGHIARYEAQASAILTGAAGFQGQTANAVNIAAHQSLVSGASLNNMVGIQRGYLTKGDTIDPNFITSQEFANNAYNLDVNNKFDYSPGLTGNDFSNKANSNADSSRFNLAQTAQSTGEATYTSGSLILDDYRLPTKSKVSLENSGNLAQFTLHQNLNGQSYIESNKYESAKNYDDDSGVYVHDPSGDHAEPYRHNDLPAIPYVHDNADYKQSSDYYDYNRYYSSSRNVYKTKDNDDSGQYVHANSATFAHNSFSNEASESNLGTKNEDYSALKSVDYGKYAAGVYKADGLINSGLYQEDRGKYIKQYSSSNSGKYLSDSKVRMGESHTLTAGAVNVDLVGKTTLVDSGYINQFKHEPSSGDDSASTLNHGSSQQNIDSAHLSYVSYPAVSIHHLGTDENNLDGYAFGTTPTSSGIPTTATPFAVTTALPTTSYTSAYVPQQPITNIKQILYSQQPITYVKPTVVSLRQDGIIEHNTFNNQSSEALGSKGYQYSKPDIIFEDGITPTTPVPGIIGVSTYKPRGFSHNQQILHKVEAVGFDYTTAIPQTEPPFKKLVAYTTGTPKETLVQSTVVGAPQPYSHQINHKVELSNTYDLAIDNDDSKITFQTPKHFVSHTIPQPTVSSTLGSYIPGHQTIHNVDVSKINKYPASTGYNYEYPHTSHDLVKTEYVYSTSRPAISTYKPQAYSHQIINQLQQHGSVLPMTPKPIINYYQQHTVTKYENPLLKYTTNVTPLSYIQQTVSPLSYSQQTIHKTSDQKVVSADHGKSAYESKVAYDVPNVAQFSTPQSIVYEKPVITPYENKLHIEGQINSYSNGQIGYEYQKPIGNYINEPQYTTETPISASTYKPQSYSQQTYHQLKTQNFGTISATSVSPQHVIYQKPAVSINENPLFGYPEKIPHSTPIAPVTQIVQHHINHINQPTVFKKPVQLPNLQQNIKIDQEQISYSQPEIQRNNENLRSGQSHSDATLVSHQSNLIHNPPKDVAFVSTTPATLVYEDHYMDFEPHKQIQYGNPEYVLSKNNYQQSYVTQTGSSPIVQVPSSDIHLAYNDEKHNRLEYSEQYNTKTKVQQVTESTNHNIEPKEESIHLSTYPGLKDITKYQQADQKIPEIQVAYKAEEYLPPIVSSTYSPITSEYLPITTVRSSTTHSLDYESEESSSRYQIPDSLSPLVNSGPKVVHFESFGLKNSDGASNFNVNYNPYQKYNISVPFSTSRPISSTSRVIETAKPHLLGFGTVAPDAGLVSPANFITSSPIVTSTYRPLAKPTTNSYLLPTFKVVESNTRYKAPEYLPPATQDKSNINNYDSYNQNGKIDNSNRPFVRKQNIVVQTAKSQFGYGSVGSDESIVSSTQTPIILSSQIYSSTLSPTVITPLKDETDESIISTPIKRVKPKVAIVTKINDFNPLLVRKLGAVCSCQSPVLILKGTRPKAIRPQQDLGDYSDDYNDSGRGDISEHEISQKSWKEGYPPGDQQQVTVTPLVTSTFNPIIVPDDSYYQDLQGADNYESIKSSGLKAYTGNYVSSTPSTFSTTEKFVKIRPRVKAVTIAPTYKTVILNQEVAAKLSPDSTLRSQAFDRYGPGGWRNRDETLQGSIDCQRAGLFRHPKQCNKFYACRWDCTKQRFTLHVFNCPVHLSFDESLGACNWPSQGPACQGDTLLNNL